MMTQVVPEVGMTEALDVATIFHALRTLETEFLGPEREWHARGRTEENVQLQLRLFRMYRRYGSLVDAVRDLKAKASTDWQVLNAFLTNHRFDPMFDDSLDGIGVVSILDKLVKWLVEGTTTTLYGKNDMVYPAFSLSPEGVNIYQVAGYPNQPLVELKTQSDDVLFLMLVDEAVDGLDMIEMVLDVVHKQWTDDSRYAGLVAPKVDFDIKPSIGFLKGAYTYDEYAQYWYIFEAKQQFKFRMNEKGARAKVATGIALRKAISEGPIPLVIDRPFYGFFLQRGIPLPLAIFRAGYDSWREPAGSLEDL